MKRYALASAFTLLLLTISFATIAAEGGNTWTAGFENPRVFTENKGQFHSGDASKQILYAYDDGLNMIYFSKSGVTYTFTKKTKTEQDKGIQNIFSGINKKSEREEEENKAVCITEKIVMNWVQSNAEVQLIAEEETSDYRTYGFKVKGQMKTLTGVKCFKKLIYKNLYPHIDVEYVFHPEQGIKYSLILHPGANIAQVAMAYSQAQKTDLYSNGDLHIATRFGDIIDHAPLTYYQDAPESVIESHFTDKQKAMGFKLGTYDAGRTIVIDPWTATPAMPNCNKVWEVERDAAANAYIYGG
ncbi:MAG: hypothetical protein ACHQRM_17100, partial [Bacteroidia bacterium]